jgi:hypothetical protein
MLNNKGTQANEFPRERLRALCKVNLVKGAETGSEDYHHQHNHLLSQVSFPPGTSPLEPVVHPTT